MELAVVSSVSDQLLGFWQGFLINLGTDALGVAITVLVLNALQERAQEEQLKKQLIREMGSRIKDVAVPASEEMRARQAQRQLTGRALLEAFAAYTVVLLRFSDGSQLWTYPELTTLQADLLAAFDLPAPQATLLLV